MRCAARELRPHAEGAGAASLSAHEDAHPQRAYADSGLRATVSINHQNLVEYVKYPFLEQILPAEIRAEMDRAPRAGTQEMADLYRWYLATWHGAENGRLRIAVSNSAPQRVS